MVEESKTKLTLQPDMRKSEKIEINIADIAKRDLSKLSPMPTGLLNTFSKEEILDLMAYLESMGKRDHPNFKK